MFDTAVSTILNREDEEKCWALYLSCMANPFAEQMSFNEFMKKYGTNNVPTVKTEEHEMNGKQIQKQIEQAEKMLHGFKPPKKECDVDGD